MVGWKAGAWGYHSDDGKFFYQVGFGAEYGPTYKEGDTVGCGLDPALYEKDPNHPALFFTHNGKHLGSVFIDLHERPYPAVSLKGKKARFSVNFGEKEFVWKGAVYEGASADEAKEDEGEGEDGEEKDDDYNAEGQEEVKTDVADDQC